MSLTPPADGDTTERVPPCVVRIAIPQGVEIGGALVRADGVSLAEAEAIAARVALLLKRGDPCGDVQGLMHVAHEMLEPRQRHGTIARGCLFPSSGGSRIWWTC